jgi:hypothetical protein
VRILEDAQVFWFGRIGGSHLTRLNGQVRLPQATARKKIFICMRSKNIGMSLQGVRWWRRVGGSLQRTRGAMRCAQGNTKAGKKDVEKVTHNQEIRPGGRGGYVYLEGIA